MTAGNVISAARELLHDTTAGSYRWSDTNLLIYVDAAQRRARLLRPDLFLVSGAISEPGSPGNVDATLVLGYDWQVPLARYVAGMALQEDSGDTEQYQRGRDLVAKFEGEDLGMGLGR